MRVTRSTTSKTRPPRGTSSAARKPAREPAPRPPASPRRPKVSISRAGVAAPTADDFWAGFHAVPVATVLLADGLVLAANDAFHRALGLAPGSAPAQRLDALLPPEEGRLPTPRPGATRSYRSRVGGVPARVDLAAAAAPRPDGSVLAVGVLTFAQEAADTAAERGLLALSRALGAARDEGDVTAALAGALELLFPGRAFSIRLLEPRTLALTTFHGRGPLRSGASGRLAVRGEAAQRAGLDLEALRAEKVALVATDEPLFDGCQRALVEPLAVAGELLGLVGLEYAVGEPGDRDADASLLLQVASHAALGVWKVRALEEAARLAAEREHLVEQASALVFAVDRDRRVTVWNGATAHATGCARGDAVGRDVLLAVAPDDRARARDGLERALGGEAVSAVELRLLRAGGGEARVTVSLAAQLGASGEVEGAVAIGQDLTPPPALHAAAHAPSDSTA